MVLSRDLAADEFGLVSMLFDQVPNQLASGADDGTEVLVDVLELLGGLAILSFKNVKSAFL